MGLRKRKRKRKRKSNSPEFGTFVTFEDAGVHLPCFVAGLVTSVIGILLIWSSVSKSQSTKHALEAVENGESVKASVDPEEFDVVLASGNAKQLSTYLISLNSALREKKTALELETASRRRVDLARKMLTLKLIESQRELAVESMIDALATIYGMDFQFDLSGANVSETLRVEAGKYSKDANERISRKARLVMLKHNSFERLKRPIRPPIDLIVDQMIEMLEDYPDEEVLATIQLIVSYYIENNPKEALSLMQKIQSGTSKFSAPNIVALVQEISDLARMLQLNYVKDFDDRWVNGTVGEKGLYSDSLDLLSNANYGETVVHNVDRVTQWFEQENQYRRAIEIYQQMLKSSTVNANPEIATLARKTAESGLRRAELLQRKLVISGISHQGNPLDPAAFENRVVIVLFWSASDPESVKALNQIYEETQGWRLQGGKLIAVSRDSSIGPEFRSLVEPLSDVTFAVGDASRNGENPIWEQFPCSILPRAILIDRNGVVVDIHVPVSEVKREAGFLMSR